MKILFALSLGLLVSSASFGQAQPDILGPWEGFSDPEIMDSGFTHVVNALPLEGSMLDGKRAWSGHYWPSKKGSINYRWNAEKKEGYEYKSPKADEVRSLSLDELKKLAPSEKYDLLMGRYDYPLRKEARGASNRFASDWAGICHGWAPSSLHHNEPAPKVLTDPQGIQIPFGTADIKALLAYYYAFYHEVENAHQMGLRCFFGSWLGGGRSCGEDLNAGAFHIVIANKLGLRKEGMLMDVDRYNEVWNQPLVGFKSKVVDAYLPRSKKAAKNAAYEIGVATELFYTDESDPTWELVQGTKEQVISKKDLVYRLEISADGKIVGGDWESEERPDFLWYVPKAESFTGYFEKLPLLLND